MSSGEGTEEKEDPIKTHREGTALSDVGKHKEAMEKFLRASELYEKAKNLFDASYVLFKAAECNYILKDYSNATERFLEAADTWRARALQRSSHFDSFPFEYVIMKTFMFFGENKSCEANDQL